MLFLFATALFVNALLLFWVQPMFGKMVLPLLGGSPSVWTTCMLFFQAALLAGYAYSHVGLRLLGIRRQALVHAVIVWLPLFVLPIGIRQAGAPPADHAPIAWLLGAMALSVGPPFVVLATTAPLLQRWFSTCDRTGSDPYRLYAASNAGSLIALLAFPIVLEPLIALGSQQTIWKMAYAAVAALLTLCALVAVRHAPAPEAAVEHADDTTADPAPAWNERLRWLMLAFAPSSLMLGVTTYLSTDVAAVPLLWVLPLALYLLTFILVFGAYSEITYKLAARFLPLLLIPLVIQLITRLAAPLSIALPLHLGVFTLLALLCHGELARSRPSVRHLTEFYLWLAAGGVLGGAFNTLVAPYVFTAVVEYPLALAVACLLCASVEDIRNLVAQPRALLRPALGAAIATIVVITSRRGDLGGIHLIAFLGAPALVAFSVRREPARFAFGIIGLFTALAIGAVVAPAQGGRLLHADRTFFGVYRVVTDDEHQFVSLAHGTTLHGRQVIGVPDPEPLTYFYRGSPVGEVFAARGDRARSVGVVGLGVGTLAAYARPDSSWTFYEIDPAIENIARDNRFFRYLERCGNRCRVVLGDARLTLAANRTPRDVLVLDAFSSDAIPIHLMNVEAFKIYDANLAPGGILAFHISNRHFNLRPVLARLARESGWTGYARIDRPTDISSGFTASEWVVMARTPEDLAFLGGNSRWDRLAADGAPAWSDDFSNIWTAIRWRDRANR